MTNVVQTTSRALLAIETTFEQLRVNMKALGLSLSVWDDLGRCVLNCEGACEFCEFLTYCVETLGAIGERFPDVALRTLQYLIEEWIDFRRPVTFHGRCRTPAEQVVRASLLRIKSYHPKAVDGMVEALPAEHLQRLRSVVMLEPEPEPDAMLSYCGERIYQRAFLTSEGCRRTFGRGVARAGRARSVSQLFAAFSREILVWLRSD